MFLNLFKSEQKEVTYLKKALWNLVPRNQIGVDSIGRPELLNMHLLPKGSVGVEIGVWKENSQRKFYQQSGHLVCI